MLQAFLRWLNDNYVIDHHAIKSKNDTGFYVRFRIQKCMYMAHHLGLGTDYHYKQYVYGPYSKELTKRYYDYEPAAPVTEQLPPDFDKIGNVVLRAHSRGFAWMEVATTILQDACECIDMKEQYARDQIERNVSNLKYQYTDGYIHAVYDDLLGMQLGKDLPVAPIVQATV